MNRKTFVKNTTLLGTATAVLPKFSFAQVKGSDKLKIAIVGCGSRGIFDTTMMIKADKNIEIIAVADLFEENLTRFENAIKQEADKIESGFFDKLWKVGDRRFTGLEAIDKIVQTDADIVALMTVPVFRPYHIEKCLKAGKHVFAEKPIAIDAVGLRKIYKELIPLADSKQLKVLCGTQKRYQTSIQEAINRLRDGQIGDVVSCLFMRNIGRYLTNSSSYTNEAWALQRMAKMSPDVAEYQLMNWLCRYWTSGDQFVEQFVHNLDLAMWAIGGELPYEVVGFSGQMPTYANVGNNCSHTFANFEFKSGITLSAGCSQEANTSRYSPFKVIGTKGILEMSFQGQRITGEKPWSIGAPRRAATLCEHEVFYDAIRNGKKFNKLKECADSCYVAIAGRESAYTGKRMKCAWVLERSQREYMPKNLTLDMVLPKMPTPSPATYELI